MKHREIRAAVLSALKANITEQVTWFDGRPVFIDEQELPAVAVYLTDASAADEFVDEDTWEAVLHIEVFLRAKETDSAMDTWMEEKIFPAMEGVPGLSSLLLKM
ncbi:phage tail protein, partial [Escherichia coli]